MQQNLPHGFCDSTNYPHIPPSRDEVFQIPSPLTTSPNVLPPTSPIAHSSLPVIMPSQPLLPSSPDNAIAVIGGGGHASIVISAAQAAGLSVLGTN